MKVKLKDVRLAFPALFEPRAYRGSKPRFQATLIFDKNSEQHNIVKQAIKEVATSKWGPKLPKMPLCLHDGKEKDLDGFGEGKMFISAASQENDPPRVVDQARKDLPASNRVIYPGCQVVAIIDIWPQDNEWGKRINASLKGIQFYADNDRFSGSAPVTDDEFEDLSDGEEAFDDTDGEEDMFSEEDSTVDDFLA